MNVILTIFGLIFLIPFLLFILLILKLLKKSRDSSWSGKVIGKDTTTIEDFDTGRESTNYLLLIKIENGNDKKVAVSKMLYDSCTVGDKIEKPKGTLIPRKVN